MKMVLASWTPCAAVCHTLPPSSCSNRSSGLSEQLVKSSTVNCFQAGKLADCHCHDSRAYTLSLSLHIVFNYILTFALSLTVYPCQPQCTNLRHSESTHKRVRHKQRQLKATHPEMQLLQSPRAQCLEPHGLCHSPISRLPPLTHGMDGQGGEGKGERA